MTLKAPGGNRTGAIQWWASGAPAAGLGVDGETYLDTLTGNIYSKSAGSWSLIASWMGPSRIYSVDLTATVNFSLLTGRQEVDIAGVTFGGAIGSLLTTDRILECQPVASLPGNLTIGYAFCPTNGTLRTAYSTPSLLTFSGSFTQRLTVYRP